VVECLEEAGDDLFTFLRFPKLQWKALRTTNALERINEEFRRRTKTQASLPSQDAVLLLLFGLMRSGQIRLRRLDGWHEMHPSFIKVFPHEFKRVLGVPRASQPYIPGHPLLLVAELAQVTHG